MTQLKFDFNSTTEDVLKAFRHHRSMFLFLRSESITLITNNDVLDPVIRELAEKKYKEMDFHFEQYEKARDILDSREVY